MKILLIEDSKFQRIANERALVRVWAFSMREMERKGSGSLARTFLCNGPGYLSRQGTEQPSNRRRWPENETLRGRLANKFRMLHGKRLPVALHVAARKVVPTAAHSRWTVFGFSADDGHPERIVLNRRFH
jgi:hypothetical protein